MNTFESQLEALNQLASIPGRTAQELAAIDREHSSARDAASATERHEHVAARELVTLVEETLAAARTALARVGLENAVPRRVRPSPDGDPAAIRQGREALDEAHRRLDAAVGALLAHREAVRDQRRAEFLDDEARRAAAERERLTEELRRKQEAERLAQAAARRRRTLTAVAAVGLGVLVVLIIVLTLS